MTVSFQVGEIVNGFKITTVADNQYYTAENEQVSIRFYTNSGNGQNYCRIISYINLKTEKAYIAMRYLVKYIPAVQGFSNELYKKFIEVNIQIKADE